MRICFVRCAAFVGMLLPAASFAAEWQLVAKAGSERVDIDKARIMRNSQNITIAWTRLTLAKELKDASGTYTAVEAMNRYDCGQGKFATLKRVYLNGEAAIREDRVVSPADVVAVPGSLDGKLLTEACKLRTIGEAYSVAAAAAEAANTVPQGDKPGVMYADVRAAGDTPKAPPALKVAAEDEHPASAAETKIEIRPPTERPRFIGLPKMEKPNPTPDETEKPADAKPEAKAALPAQKTEASRPADKKPLPAKGEVSKPARDVAAKPAAEPASTTGTSGISRMERERQLATSGPRRARPGTTVPAGVAEHRDIHWTYEGEGAPDNWSKLKPEYRTCATGKRQSPIDIREGIRVDLEPIKFDYQPTYFRIVNNGHSIQVDVGEGSTITVMGRTYELLQFHFHRPSEERINGKSFDMVIHLVHRDADDKLAVIAVLLDHGPENPTIQALWNNMPLEVNQEVVPDVSIDLNSLLPTDRAYYTYMGSLTTPPCTEDVLWMVFKQPLPISAEQVAVFSHLYQYNARPIQPANGRLVKENR